MGFFDSLPPPEPDEPEPIRERPPWTGPPHGVLPTVVPIRAVVFKTEELLFIVDHFCAYPSGVSFEVNVFERNPDPRAIHEPLLALHHPRGESDDVARFGIRLADGQSWSSTAWTFPRWENASPDRMVVHPGGGGGGDGRWTTRYWLWPLPPDGPITFYADWPARDVPESSAAIDGSILRAAAAEAEVIWPEQ